MIHSTKWNRMTVNKALVNRLYSARVKYLNDYDKIGSKTAKGISKTIYPDGTIKNY